MCTCFNWMAFILKFLPLNRKIYCLPFLLHPTVIATLASSGLQSGAVEQTRLRHWIFYKGEKIKIKQVIRVGTQLTIKLNNLFYQFLNLTLRKHPGSRTTNIKTLLSQFSIGNFLIQKLCQKRKLGLQNLVNLRPLNYLRSLSYFDSRTQERRKK